MPRARPAQPGSLAYALRALGRRDLPETVEVAGVSWRLTQTVKHDFYAATGFYQNDRGDRAVLKVGRVVDFAGMPLLWLGRWLCRRELRFYRKLHDLPNVPAVLGTVGQTGFLHAYVEGKPLSKTRPVPDGFFHQLKELFLELHRRGIAYVDTNKPENILQGDDGRPHLIDFQISFDGHELGGGRWLLPRLILRRLQHEDLYHFLKHKSRLRPDELSEQEKLDAQKRSWFIRAHRLLTKPYFLIRRRTFKRLRDSGQLLPEGSK